MKIRLPEKRFYSIEELACRWGCSAGDVIHLIETGELKPAMKLAALHGKHRILYAYYGYQIDPDRPCFVPCESLEDIERWNKSATPDQVVFSFPVMCDFPVDNEEDHYKIFGEFEKQIAEYAKENEEDFSTVVLLQDVLQMEARCLAEESQKGAADTPSDTRSNKLTILNQAATRFWGNVDMSDKTTYSKNSDVIAWLVERGYSQTLAASAASIIRPEWAETGRPPEK